MQINPADNSAAMERVTAPSAPMPIAMIAGAAIALVAFIALPWVDSFSLARYAAEANPDRPMALVLIGVVLLAFAVAATSFKTSRRWLTAPAALLLLPPTLLPAVISHGQLGTKIAPIGALIALVGAIAMTVKPVRN